MGWEVVGWQGVTNFEESAENYFGRILLPRRERGLATVRHGGEGGDEGERVRGRDAVLGARRKTSPLAGTGWPMRNLLSVLAGRTGGAGKRGMIGPWLSC